MSKTRTSRRLTFRSLEDVQKAYLPTLYQERKTDKELSEKPEEYGTTLAKQLVSDLTNSLS